MSPDGWGLGFFHSRPQNSIYEKFYIKSEHQSKLELPHDELSDDEPQESDELPPKEEGSLE